MKPYCGIGKLPKNRIYGDPDYCLRHGQARLYGKQIVPMDIYNEYLKYRDNVKFNKQREAEMKRANKRKKQNAKLIEELTQDELIRDRYVMLIDRITEIEDELMLNKDMENNPDKYVTKGKTRETIIKNVGDRTDKLYNESKDIFEEIQKLRYTGSGCDDYPFCMDY